MKGKICAFSLMIIFQTALSAQDAPIEIDFTYGTASATGLAACYPTNKYTASSYEFDLSENCLIQN